MSDNTPVANSGAVKTGASVLIAGALVSLIREGLGMAHVTMPAAMDANLIMLLTPVVHFIAQKIEAPKSKSVPAAADPSAPIVIPAAKA